MFSLHLFSASSSVASTLTATAPVTDPVLAISGNFMFVPQLSNLIGAYALGNSITRAQLTSPSLSTNVPYDITPVDAALVPSSPLPLHLHPLDPIPLVIDEPLGFNQTHTGGDQESAFVFLSDGPLTKVSGKIIRVRATFTTTTTGFSWQNASLTLTNQLAEGNYQLVGARAEGAHLVATRFVFPGGTNATRPGMIAEGNASKFDAQHIFRDGNLGVWGVFSNRVLPTIDHISDGTSETAVVILDLIKQ